MADKAHRLTDEKLEEMEKRLSAIYSRTERAVQKKMADYAKSIDWNYCPVCGAKMEGGGEDG